jgi:hypothetical protein
MNMPRFRAPAVALGCPSREALDGAVLLLAQALKGSLPTAEALDAGQSDATVAPLVVSSAAAAGLPSPCIPSHRLPD